MREDMQLRGYSERTQDSYLRVVRQLAEHYHKSPDQISEEEIRQYLLYLTNERKLARSTCTLVICGLKFFYEQTLGRPWTRLELVRPRRERKLPVVLSREEVQQVVNQVWKIQYQVCLGTIYACGLRLGEAQRLRVDAVDGERKLLHIRQGKGGQDRYVPIPERTLKMLRRYWRSHQHPEWLFPARGRRGVPAGKADQPVCASSIQKAFRAAVQESGIRKRATVHTLRHSYATHLFEAGVSLRLIQAYLGHRSLRSTMIYTHLTEQAQQPAIEVINEVMDSVWD
jgi:site-specific recombinase XerD